MRPVQVAVIGTGWITQYGYLPHLITSKEVEIAAAYDTSLSSLHQMAQQLELPKKKLSLEACFSPQIEGVLLCTPPYVHSGEIRQCIAHGKYVLCEKPVCRNFEEMSAVGSTEELQSRLMGSAAMRLREDVAQLLAWVNRGLLGELYKIRLGWWREKGVPSAGSWRTDPMLSPLGVMEDLGPHLLDIIAALNATLNWKNLHLKDANLICKYGDSARGADWFASNSAVQYLVPDQAQARFISDCGVEIQMDTCWVNDLPGDCCSIHLEGSHGTATFEGLLGFSTARRSSSQYCSLHLSGCPVEVRHFPIGPELQHRAFAKSIAIFARFCRTKATPVASYCEIRQVAEWLTQIEMTALRGVV